MRQIRLTESELHRVIKESVFAVLAETEGNYETWYRGYDSGKGFQRDNLIWITDDISYAKTYGNCVDEVVLDLNKLRLTSIYRIDEILGYEFDYYEGLTEEEANEVLSQGYNGYEFEANQNSSDCICLFNASPIVSRRRLTDEEYNAIEEN